MTMNFKKKLFYIVYRYNCVEPSDSFLIKTLKEQAKIIYDERWNKKI
jgi:hypothetical protein